MPITGDMLFQMYRADMVGRGITSHSLTTYDRVVSRFEAWLEAQQLQLEDVKRPHLQLFLQSTGWAPRTQRTARSYLSAAWEYAVDEELADRNPCRRVRLPKPAQHVVRTIPPADLRRMWRDARDADDQLLLALFMFTGMRTIEVRRLTWNDVSLADNMLTVHGKREPGQPVKQRLVPIHPRLRHLLVGRTWAYSSAHVAAGRHGDMVTAAGLHYRIKRAAGDTVRCHDFRRTVATSLRQNGVDSVVRDALMGWTRGDVFSRHYSAVTPPELQAAVLKLYADAPIS